MVAVDGLDAVIVAASGRKEMSLGVKSPDLA